MNRTADVIERELAPVALLLFGSQAREESSDFDFGLYFGSGSAPDPFALAGLRTRLEDVLGRDVDLVILDGASPIVRMEALRRHRMLFCRDREQFTNFVARTMIDYADLKRVRAPIESAIRTG